MTSSNTQEWTPCAQLQIGDTLKWSEPLWAAPNKPRGKRDKIGEQEIIAQLMVVGDLLEFKVINVKKTSDGEAPITVKENDDIRRKASSLEKGNCHKLVE